MLKTETNTGNEYWQRLQKYVSNDPDVAGMEARCTFGGASHHPMIEQLANEYVKEIVRLKDEVNSMSSIGFGIFRSRPGQTQVRDHCREEVPFGGTEREGQEDMATAKGPGRKEAVTEWDRWGNISTKRSPLDYAI